MASPITGEGANMLAIGKWAGLWALCVLQGIEGLPSEVPGRMGAWHGRCGFLSRAPALEEAGGSTLPTLGFWFFLPHGRHLLNAK